MNSQTILILGAGGFVGKHLVKRLSREGYADIRDDYGWQAVTSLPDGLQMSWEWFNSQQNQTANAK